MHTVELGWEKRGLQKQRWSEANTGDALFAPDSITLAKKLAQEDSINIRFTPFKASPQIATFRLEGLDNHLQKVANACGWSYRSSHSTPLPMPSAASLADTTTPLSRDELLALCRNHVAKKLSPATLTFDESDRQVVEWEGQLQVFGRAIVSSDKKRQFRTFMCSVKDNMITFF